MPSRLRSKEAKEVQDLRTSRTYHGILTIDTPELEQELLDEMKLWGRLKTKDWALTQEHYNTTGKVLSREHRTDLIRSSSPLDLRSARMIVESNNDTLDSSIKVNKRNIKAWTKEMEKVPSHRKYIYLNKIEQASKISVCLGGKKLFKEFQRNNNDQVKQQWLDKRLFFGMSGDSSKLLGNSHFRLFPTDHPDLFRVSIKLSGKKMQEVGTVRIKSRKGQREILRALTEGTAISCRVIRTKKKFKLHISPVFKAVRKGMSEGNTPVVGVDFNSKHFDATLMDRTANVLDQKVFTYKNGKDLPTAVSDFMRWVDSCGARDVVIEGLSGINRSRSSKANGHAAPAVRKVVNQLPVKIFKTSLESSIINNYSHCGISIVSPSYTSKNTAEWQEPIFGSTTHEKASYLIGRRGLGYSIDRKDTVRSRQRMCPAMVFDQESNPSSAVGKENQYYYSNPNRGSSSVRVEQYW